MDRWKERWVDKLARLGRCAETRWIVCGHGYSWAVTLYITVPFHRGISG